MALLVSARAKRDLDDIWYEVAVGSGSEERANAQLDAIGRVLRLIGEYPLLGRHRPDLREGLRSFPVGSYIILYRADGGTAKVLHVLPAMRDIVSLI
ncbi:MAG TPA: type II toxin-antitoxin system RelE/ParE family toxin [Alphaproteobacteria bacterium]|jgi:toxin ParE1/3/4|nr:type II toxin-antitoxin system RelE/ParE family toxin [Alphaproteobacteria bacterium]